MAKALALFQYQVAGDYLKSFTVNHANDVTGLFNELPFLYCVAIIKRDGQKVTPFGGFIIKTDIAKDDPKLTEHMYDAAKKLEKVSEILKYGSTIQVTPIKYESSSFPDAEKCEEWVVGALYLYGWGGNA